MVLYQIFSVLWLELMRSHAPLHNYLETALKRISAPAHNHTTRLNCVRKKNYFQKSSPRAYAFPHTRIDVLTAQTPFYRTPSTKGVGGCSFLCSCVCSFLCSMNARRSSDVHDAFVGSTPGVRRTYTWRSSEVRQAFLRATPKTNTSGSSTAAHAAGDDHRDDI